jgi:hypothetical protein
MSAEPLLFSWEQVARALFVAADVRSGLWRIGGSLKFAATMTGPSEAQMMPSGVVAVEELVLVPVDAPGPLVFDASAIMGSTRERAARPAKERKASVPVKRAPKTR